MYRYIAFTDRICNPKAMARLTTRFRSQAHIATLSPLFLKLQCCGVLLFCPPVSVYVMSFTSTPPLLILLPPSLSLAASSLKPPHPHSSPPSLSSAFYAILLYLLCRPDYGSAVHWWRSQHYRPQAMLRRSVRYNPAASAIID